MNNAYFTVCGIVEIGGKVLLVRHTYGSAKDRILLPGGYVHENELPNIAVEREILEETGVSAKTKSLMAMQFKPDQWCAVFFMDYLSGTPKSDEYENSEVLLLKAEEAVNRTDITNMSREILTAYINNKDAALNKSNYVPRTMEAEQYALFEV